MRKHKAMIIVFVLTIWGLALCSSGFADITAQIEEEFIPGKDSGFFYTIKKGDTLWDLSQKFYDSEWDWPGLWKINKDIKNPHWIYPGKRIHIFLKEKAPLGPKIIEAKKYPPEPPVEVKPSFSYTEIDHISFLKKEPHPSLGEIIKEEENNLLMTQNDIVYIKPSGEGTLVPGKEYQIFTTTRIKTRVGDESFTGIKHLIKARIKILDHKVSYATALITHSYRPAQIGDMIMDYEQRNPVMTVEKNPAPIDARIIASQDDHLMINDYIIAFINIGKDHVKPGQIYTVNRKNTLKNNKQIQLENLPSGKLIILHTEDISSTVMILSSKYAIHPDDMVN